MTQDAWWAIRYKEVVEYIETNKRNPLKHRVEDHYFLNWLMANRKAINVGKMKQERVGRSRILGLME